MIILFPNKLAFEVLSTHDVWRETSQFIKCIKETILIDRVVIFSQLQWWKYWALILSTADRMAVEWRMALKHVYFQVRNKKKEWMLNIVRISFWAHRKNKIFTIVISARVDRNITVNHVASLNTRNILVIAKYFATCGS